MELEKLTTEELRQLLRSKIEQLSDEDCRSILTEQKVAKRRAS
jgi:hypothetical protein